MRPAWLLDSVEGGCGDVCDEWIDRPSRFTHARTRARTLLDPARREVLLSWSGLRWEGKGSMNWGRLVAQKRRVHTYLGRHGDGRFG